MTGAETYVRIPRIPRNFTIAVPRGLVGVANLAKYVFQLVRYTRLVQLQGEPVCLLSLPMLMAEISESRKSIGSWLGVSIPMT